MKNSHKGFFRLGLIHYLLESQFWFPIWVIFLLDRNFSIGQVVIADVVFRTSMVLLEFPLGVLGDKLGRKTTYFLGAIAGFLTYVIFILTQNVVLLIVCWIVWAVFLALLSGTDTAYRYELMQLNGIITREVHIFGYFQAITAVALVISHGSAGYLYTISPSLPLFINAAFAMIAAIMILSLPKIEPIGKDVKVVSLKIIFRSTLGYFKSNKDLQTYSIIIAIWTAFHWTPTLIFQPLLQEMGIATGSFGLIFVGFTSLGIAGGMLAGKLSDRFGKRPMIIISIIIQVLAIAITGFAKSSIIILGGIIILRFAFFLSEPILKIMINKNIENSVRASVISGVNLLASFIMIFSRPLIGLITEKNNVFIAFRVWFYIGLGLLFLSVWLIYRKDQIKNKVRIR